MLRLLERLAARLLLPVPSVSPYSFNGVVLAFTRR